MRGRFCVAFGFLLLLSFGCDVVYVSEPIGESPHPIDAAEWEGSWIVGEGVAWLRVIDETQGTIELMTIEVEKESEPELQRMKIFLRESDDGRFFSVEEPMEEAENDAADADRKTPPPRRYHWGIFRRDEAHLIAWLPRLDRFKALVEEGALPGEVLEGGDVLLGPLEAEHLALIQSEEDRLFSWKEPFVMTRTGP
jgi:hypothetical protein